MDDFKEIYDTYSQMVYRFLLAMTGDVYAAEELLQETFYQAFLHIGKFEGRCSVYTWLCQIGKNAWYKECQRNKRQIYTEKYEELENEHSLEEDIIRREECQNVRKAIFKLKQPYQDVLAMHIFGEVPLKEIANHFGKTESWAYVTYYRAKNMIRMEVEE